MAGPTDLEQLLLQYINDARLDPLGATAGCIVSYSPHTSDDTIVGSGGILPSSREPALVADRPLS
jgi:hypothetical protein